MGSYLNEQNIAEKRMPTRNDLDRVCPDHPVFLLHATIHMCSLTQRAWRLYRIEHLELPTFNQMERMANAGIMTGIQLAFICQENMELQYKDSPSWLYLPKKRSL